MTIYGDYEKVLTVISSFHLEYIPVLLVLAFIKREGHRVWLHFNPTIISAPELIARITAKHAVTDLFVENPPIEELIARLYGNCHQ